MKTTIKYIALLIFSGVIVPLYLHTGVFKPITVNIPLAKTSVIDDNRPDTDRMHFYFLHDIAAKILPVGNFF